ncbi:hypothetical protein K7X08_032395 [Anisodus acutangulus]|uniref:Pentatricopeptide repeat-containing protein n=1 Tax=Anisodus acutangulus TaxID=402998 RepID=A0A9Q1LWZ1_9SOLA|nr:hypothetical protein K7X08_032395 [Anisodus acutangulus]
MDSIKILSSLNVSTSLKQAKLLHQKIVTLGLQSNIILSKNLINLYISCQDFHSAKLVFHNLDYPLDITLWNGLVAAYTKNHMFNEALHLFEKLLQSPYLKPDSYTFPSVLKACTALGNIQSGQMIHAHLIKTGILSDVVVTSSVIGLYAKCDLFGSAIQLFDEMPERDIACWNTVISCYYQSGQFAKALQFFQKMKDLRYMPNSVTYTAAIASCGRLLDAERGEIIHQELVNNKFLLDGFHGKFLHAYVIRNNVGSDFFLNASLVDLYFKCGRVETAQNVFRRITKKNVEAWNVMISGYVSAGCYLEALAVYNDMKDNFVFPNKRHTDHKDIVWSLLDLRLIVEKSKILQIQIDSFVIFKVGSLVRKAQL